MTDIEEVYHLFLESDKVDEKTLLNFQTAFNINFERINEFLENELMSEGESFSIIWELIRDIKKGISDSIATYKIATKNFNQSNQPIEDFNHVIKLKRKLKILINKYFSPLPNDLFKNISMYSVPTILGIYGNFNKVNLRVWHKQDDSAIIYDKEYDDGEVILSTYFSKANNSKIQKPVSKSLTLTEKVKEITVSLNNINEEISFLKQVHSEQKEIKDIEKDLKNYRLEATKIDKSINDSKVKLSRLETELTEKYQSEVNAIKEQEGLNAQVITFNDKKEFHKKGSIWSGSVLAAVIIIFLSVTFFNFDSFTTFIADEVNSTKNSIIFFLIISLVLYLIRLISKVYTSHMHLYLDCNEKLAILKTYLDLVAKGHLDTEKDRELVLTPLFTKSSTGIVNDIPLGTLESLKKMMGK